MILKTTSIVDGCLLSLGTIYSLANIEQILGVLILVVQLVWLSFKVGVKIYNTIKNKKPIQTNDEDVEEIKELYEDLKEKINPKENDNVNPKE